MEWVIAVVRKDPGGDCGNNWCKLKWERRGEILNHLFILYFCLTRYLSFQKKLDHRTDFRMVSEIAIPVVVLYPVCLHIQVQKPGNMMMLRAYHLTFIK